MRLAVIPARGGSKRIPHKNIKPFAGRPIIGYSIKAAIESECFDRVIVSTDDVEIADVAQGFGGEIPFMRPASLSGDMVGTIDVIAHAINEIANAGDEPTEVCCIYATAPFIQSNDLRKAWQLLRSPGISYSFPVAPYPAPIQRALRLSDADTVSMFDTEARHSRSQDLRPAYHDAGQFYWGKADAWVNHIDVFGQASRALILPSYRVQDIDTPEDWDRAELMFEIISRQEAGELA